MAATALLRYLLSNPSSPDPGQKHWNTLSAASQQGLFPSPGSPGAPNQPPETEARLHS